VSYVFDQLICTYTSSAQTNIETTAEDEEKLTYFSYEISGNSFSSMTLWASLGEAELARQSLYNISVAHSILS
jgi:hypothetical protein